MTQRQSASQCAVVDETENAAAPEPGMSARQERIIEICLILSTLGIAGLLHTLDVGKFTVLNLFFMPIVLAGFFLGRYRAGVLALLSVASAGVIVSLDIPSFGASMSPVVVAMAMTIWAAILGLTSLLVGTLSDDRYRKATEAHEAYVGVVEVLSRYLQTIHPALENRAQRVSRLSEQVAIKMRLAPKEIDNIRVAALLLDMENVEITARVIRRAVGEVGAEAFEQRTVAGADLVKSLGTVLQGAFPLLTSPDGRSITAVEESPFGARIISSVRAYLRHQDDPWDNGSRSSADIIEELKQDEEAQHHPAVLHAMQEVVNTSESPAIRHRNSDSGILKSIRINPEMMK
jgi:hypothetical protein